MQLIRYNRNTTDEILGKTIATNGVVVSGVSKFCLTWNAT